MSVYITSMGRFLPGEPIDNESMEEYLGKINGKPSRARSRVLKQNGIEARYYAIDRQQQTLISNAEMAARAVRCAVERGRYDLAAVDFWPPPRPRPITPYPVLPAWSMRNWARLRARSPRFTACARAASWRSNRRCSRWAAASRPPWRAPASSRAGC